MACDPKYPGSQDIPDVPYSAYTGLLGLKGVLCESPEKVGVTCKGVRQKLTQFAEHLPGRGHH